jgi:hypothetical protein
MQIDNSPADPTVLAGPPEDSIFAEARPVIERGAEQALTVQRRGHHDGEHLPPSSTFSEPGKTVVLIGDVLL